MFKDLLEKLIDVEVAIIRTKTGDQCEECLIKAVEEEYVEVEGYDFTSYIRISSIESITIDNEDEDDE